ncbi:MAG: nucleoside-diphosphate sugar epimerase/dehydratase [Clostridia bacterium]|nr:nucleoside-diphosphate sugar epimerase/dehydratase [Clostridia bacterium]
MNKIRKNRVLVLIIMDILIVFVAYLLSGFLITKDFFTLENKTAVINSVTVSIILQQVIFAIANLYKNITRYENGKDYLVYIVSAGAICGLTLLVKYILQVPMVGYREIVLTTILSIVGMITYRVLIRFILNINRSTGTLEKVKDVLIIGAGQSGKEIIKIIKATMKSEYNIVGVIDDNPNKINCIITGSKILGNRNDIVNICEKNKVDEIFFAIGNIERKEKKNILQICQETGAKIRVLPSTEGIIRNKSIIQNLREVEIEDILGRDPILLDNNNIAELIKDHVVLVTGGGGSIGSELCRQISTFNPQKLVIFDIYENNLYNIEIELKSKYPKMQIEAIVGSVRDNKKLESVFEKYKPYLVFHAAAHKHVPLMEKSPLEAIKNNVFGTFNAVNCADKYGVKRFLLISTDKAVNPTNIMGATKRMCEIIIQAKSRVSKTEFAAVRFGNVLGSNGSVVPLFKKQIKEGGPVTLTHKEITRFFMTIPEAVGLVLQAMTYAKGGEIFVLDMGEPVKIYDLAVSLIKLSGLEPEVDIPIQVTGLRPGEKLYEELLMNEEGLTKTAHNKIFIGEPANIKMEELNSKIKSLRQMIKNENLSLKQIKKTMKQVVPTYKEPKVVNMEVLEKVEKEEKVTAIDKMKRVIEINTNNQEVAE